MLAIPNQKTDRILYVLDFGWNILFERIVSGRIRVNKESSMKLYYSSIILQLGELMCLQPSETFTIEHESARGKSSIDITCGYDDVRAAIELKCFRRESHRAVDIDMYLVLMDISRLQSYSDFQIRKFICLTDDPYYRNPHSGHAGSVSIQEGKLYRKGVPIRPSWSGKWKGHAGLPKTLSLTNDVLIKWTGKNDWFCLNLDL